MSCHGLVRTALSAILAMLVMPLLAQELPAPLTPGRRALQQMIAEKRIINAHEHIENLKIAEEFLPTMDKLGIHKVIIVGSSKFTLTMNESFGFTDYDANNEELLRIAKAHPDRFEAWPTLNPLDPEKFEKFVSLHERGATGVKLYTGHGYVRRDNGNYMFHPIAMDDASMFPLYEYWEKHFIPVCFHVNPFNKGFAQELIEVLHAFPDMKVICPHFILSSIKSERLREYLDTFPNLYSDISYGHDDFIKAGFKRMSEDPAKFRKILADYPDRFFFGSDLVLTTIDAKTPQWITDRIQAYYDMLTTVSFTTPVMPGQTLNGLNLDPQLLENILCTNFDRFIALRPQGTKITREINWANMGVVKTDRAPGQAFPPEPRKKNPASQPKESAGS